MGRSYPAWTWMNAAIWQDSFQRIAEQLIGRGFGLLRTHCYFTRCWNFSWVDHVREAEWISYMQARRKSQGFGAHVDVIRRHHKGQLWRIRLGPLDDSQLQIGPNWQGSLTVIIEAVQTAIDGTTAQKSVPDAPLWLLAADRREYNRDSAL